MSLIGQPLADVATRLNRIGVDLISWDQVGGVQMRCQRCGGTFASTGWIGGDISKPAPKGRWFRCPKGCNASAPNPFKDVPYYDGGRPGASTFVDVVTNPYKG